MESKAPSILKFFGRGHFIKGLWGVRNKQPEYKEKPEIKDSYIRLCPILSGPNDKCLKTTHFTEPGKALTKIVTLF